MYRLADIVELQLYGVEDRGVPNRERVVLRAWDIGPVNLAQFVVTIGLRGVEAEGATPLFDGMFWFGEMQIKPKQWLFIYTGPGTRRTSSTIDGDDLFVVHWGRPGVVFVPETIVPVLLRMDAVAIGRSPDYVLNTANWLDSSVPKLNK